MLFFITFISEIKYFVYIRMVFRSEMRKLLFKLLYVLLKIHVASQPVAVRLLKHDRGPDRYRPLPGLIDLCLLICYGIFESSWLISNTVQLPTGCRKVRRRSPLKSVDLNLKQNRPALPHIWRAMFGNCTVPGRCHFKDPTQRRTGAVSFIVVPKLQRAPKDVETFSLILRVFLPPAV